MFGLSLSKLLVLALIIAAVWYGFKWLNRSKAKDEGSKQANRAADGGTDLAACPACGTYVAAGVAKCPDNRDDCPMGAA